jgi:hypothetical protein
MVAPPVPAALAGRTAAGLDWRVLSPAAEASAAPRELAAGFFPVTLENPPVFLGPLLLLLVSLAALVLLVVTVRTSGILTRLSNVDLATLSVLAAFLVLGTFIVPLLRSCGVPTVLLVAVGQLPVWLAVLAAVRLVPQPGAVGLLLFTYQIVQDLLFYGLSPLRLATETLPAVLALELWFALTGYGRSRWSALGAAPIYLLATEGLLYALVVPLFYHSYYALWYVTFTMALHGAIYLVWAELGYRTAGSVARVVR